VLARRSLKVTGFLTGSPSVAWVDRRDPPTCLRLGPPCRSSRQAGSVSALVPAGDQSVRCRRGSWSRWTAQPAHPMPAALPHPRCSRHHSPPRRPARRLVVPSGVTDVEVHAAPRPGAVPVTVCSRKTGTPSSARWDAKQFLGAALREEERVREPRVEKRTGRAC